MSKEEIKETIDFMLSESGISLMAARDPQMYEDGVVKEKDVSYNIGVIHGIRLIAVELLGDRSYQPLPGDQTT